MFKSIAVVAGSYILSILLVMCSDPILSRLFPGDFVRGRIPSTNPLIASTVCFVIASIIAAYVCARFAPSNPGKHILWLFIIGEVIGIAMTVPQWNSGWPHWYFVSWFLTWPVSCWIGLQMSGRKGAMAAATA